MDVDVNGESVRGTAKMVAMMAAVRGRDLASVCSAQSSWRAWLLPPVRCVISPLQPVCLLSGKDISRVAG